MSTSTRAPAGTREFRDLCQRFRDLEARKAVDDAIANFEQAHLIHDARARLKVPVGTICDALDLSPQSVNTYRNVAERIDEKLFRELIEARRSDGLALFPWSIVAQVARLAGKEEREVLINNIRRHTWRTREVQGYVSVERSGAAARIEDQVGHGRSRGPASGLDPDERGDRTETQRDDASSVVGALATRMEMLLKDVSRTESPTHVLVAVADVASRMIAETARDAGRTRPPAQELWEARDALTRCVAAASAARESIERRQLEARVGHGGERAGALTRETRSRAQLERPLSSI